MYYTELSESILIVHPENLEVRKAFGVRHGFKACMGLCYFGGSIGDNNSKRNWLLERRMTWEKKIETISKNAGNTPMRVSLP